MTVLNGYATLNDVKAALRITDAVDDSLIELSIEAASREIDGYCQRVFYPATGSRVYVPHDSFTVDIDDASAITSVKTSSDGAVFDTTWAVSDFQVEPLNGVVGGIVSPATRIRAIGDYLFPVYDPKVMLGSQATVQVTGSWGWVTVPTAVKQATILLAMRQFKRYDSPLGVAGFGDLGAIRVGRVDPDVQSLIAPFVKVSVA